jgi:hypothetical protein
MEEVRPYGLGTDGTKTFVIASDSTNLGIHEGREHHPEAMQPSPA